MEEVLDRFDDEHLTYMYCLNLMDGEGDEARLTARLCATVNNTVMNALRLSGKQVDDSRYKTEDDYLPKMQRGGSGAVSQSWDEMRHHLGFR